MPKRNRVTLTPAAQKQAIAWDAEGLSSRAIAGRVLQSFQVKVSHSLILDLVARYKANPDALRLLWGELEPGHELNDEIRHRLCTDAKYLHEERGWIWFPHCEEGWRLKELHPDWLWAWFRGAGKSELGDTLSLQEILRSMEAWRRSTQDPPLPFPEDWTLNVRLAIVSGREGQAEPHGNVIRQFLERDKVSSLWGDPRGQPWTSRGTFTVRQRTQDISDPTVLCGSVDSGVFVGKHPDILRLDDVVIHQNTMTARSLRSLETTLAQAIFPSRMGHTRTWWLNTPYSSLDPVSQMISAHNRKDPDAIPVMLLPAWREGADGERRATVPELRPLNTERRGKTRVRGLLEIKAELDRTTPGAFEAQYLMDTSRLQQRRLDTSMVRFIDAADLPRGLHPRMSVDMSWAFMPKARSDFTGLAIGCFDWSRGGAFYLFWAARARRQPAEIIDFLDRQYRLGADAGWWGLPDRVYVENTALFSDRVAALVGELSHIPWRQYMPRGTKGAEPGQRDVSAPLEHLFSTGRFFVVRGLTQGGKPASDWWDPPGQDSFREELDLYPGLFDDRVNALAQLVIQEEREHHGQAGGGVVSVTSLVPVPSPRAQAQSPAPAADPGFGTFKLNRRR